jgi:hypothetical protein
MSSGSSDEYAASEPDIKADKARKRIEAQSNTMNCVPVIKTP